MSWLVPYNKLDEQQRKFVDEVDITQKNIWISGFPGSGKSVLLAYTLQKIKRNSKDAKVALVVFTHSLIKMFRDAIMELNVEGKSIRDVDIMTYYDFMGKSSQKYDYILSDEIQDFCPTVLSAMNSRATHVIVAGDENQSIFEKDPKYNELTVEPPQILSLLRTDKFDLNILHRLTQNIINVVQKFLPRMNIFSAKRDMTKKSTQVRICEATTDAEEVEYIISEGKKRINVGETVAILIPNHKEIVNFVNEALLKNGKPKWEYVTNHWGKPDFGNMNSHLESNGMSLQYIGNGYGNFTGNYKLITLMTYHSSKGLDFDNVFLPKLNKQLYISNNEELNKRLFMVAMTRSKNNLFLTYTGVKNNYLLNFENDCNQIKIHDVLSGRTINNSNSGLFGGI